MFKIRPVLETCEVRSDIVSGEFNPEIFTAHLGEVVRHYQGEKTSIDPLYTNAERFFTDGTYPTEGLLNLFRNVLRRVTGGDGTAPATTRLETGFGGGKTHGLIGIVHLIKEGINLRHFVPFLEPDLLPPPNSIRFAGIVGTELNLHERGSNDNMPNTIWGEIAFQLGGEALCEALGHDATSLSAPGRRYFDLVFGDQPTVILIDELAQYATRIAFEYPRAENQVAAFLMALMGYAASHNHMALVITLSGAGDAFGDETKKLRRIIERERGEKYSVHEIDLNVRRTSQELRLVSARQEQAITLVSPDELPRITAKRLFENVDYVAAEETSAFYAKMYAKNDDLPTHARDVPFRRAIERHYPFHPTLIDLLDRKLSTIPTFQRTRGLLRVLTLTLRAIWEKQLFVPLIHSCHIDMHDPRTVDELFGRTNNSDLKAVLNADIGGATSSYLKSGRSRAQLLDQENSHPKGYPLHEWTWKVVLLHSLVGRSGEHGRALFGISEPDALLEISFPGMGAVQVSMALHEIDDVAFYLKEDKARGRYFASVEPTLNKILTEVEGEVKDAEIRHLLDSKMRDLAPHVSGFKTYAAIRHSEDIDDKVTGAKLGIIDFNVKKIRVEDFLTNIGDQPRINQNLVFLLVPCSVEVEGSNRVDRRFRDASKEIHYLYRLGRSGIACKKVLNNPQRYGIRRESGKLKNLKLMAEERDLAVKEAVANLYDSLWYAGSTGKPVRKEIKTSSQEGGRSIGEEIRRVIRDDGKLLTRRNAKTREALQSMKSLFFSAKNDISLEEISEKFSTQRRWPIYLDEKALTTLLKTGVDTGMWGMYEQQPGMDTQQVYICTKEYRRELAISEFLEGNWRIVTLGEASARGWLPGIAESVQLEDIIIKYLRHKPRTVSEVILYVRDQLGNISRGEIREKILQRLRSGQIGVFSGNVKQTDLPDDLTFTAIDISPHDDSTILVSFEYARNIGWLGESQSVLTLDEPGAVLGLLPNLGSIYLQGAFSIISVIHLENVKLEGGGVLNLTLRDLNSTAIREIGEILEMLEGKVRIDESTVVKIAIENPDYDCKLIQEMKDAGAKVEEIS